MNKKVIFNLLYVGMIIALVVFIIFAISFMSGNSRDCMQDPIAYFEKMNEGASCTCMKDGVIWPNTLALRENPDYKLPQLEDYINVSAYLK